LTENTFHISGMDCADCAKTIEAGVRQLDGVSACSLNYIGATLKVEGPSPREAVIQRVRGLGYDVQEAKTAAAQAPGGIAARLPKSGIQGFMLFLLESRDTRLAVVGALLIAPGILFNELLPMLGIQSPLFSAMALLALALAGYPIARSAWRSLVINRQISVNVLMTIAAIGAVFIGAHVEAGLVMVLFASGEALEGFTMARARDAIARLMDVAPHEATVLRSCIDCREHLGVDGYTGGPCPMCGTHEARVPVRDIRIGETVLVKPGERIAVDGRVADGVSSVNQAPITGESSPVDKSAGAEVFAGSINGEGALAIVSTNLPEDSTISRIIHMVEEAQSRKAPAERFVDQFSKYYTPAVVVVAFLVAALPPVFFQAPFLGAQGWLYRALELLVVACPCALVISTPVALISAISNAARNGVLIRGGAYLEALSRLTSSRSKTGTLTEGRPELIKIKAVDCENPEGDCGRCDTLLALASAVERRSEHPVARAITTAAEARGLGAVFASASEVTSLVGKGVSGMVLGRKVLIGSHTYFDADIEHSQESCAEVSAAARDGNTAVLISEEGLYKGYAVVADAVRASSRDAVAELTALGVSTLMLTGDTAATGARVAAQVGLGCVHADLLPRDKLDIIRAELARAKTRIAMVGDGINDAPALAAASVGIAMGGGTAQAMETADVTLMGDDLRKLPFAIRLARSAMRNIHANIAFAIAIKLAFFALVLLGLGTLMDGGFADVGASLIVT
jgi:Cd2+/Zn2+-exporting ATPase